MRKQYIHLLGGLGNQMFQYAFAYKLHRQYQCPVVLNTSSYATGHPKYKLNLFRLQEMPLENSWNFFSKTFFRILNKLNRGQAFRKAGFCTQQAMDMVDYTPKKNESMRYIGYWQNADYFSDVSEDLRNMFVLKQTIPHEVQEMADSILSKTESVCVHYRRGDYLQHSDVYMPCSDLYYADALEMMEGRDTLPYYYVFSDDIAYAKEHWQGDMQRTTFMDGSFEDIHDLYLMTQCDNFIVANSTFSWWGAYLSKKKQEKIVIAPEKFFLNGNTYYPKEWIRINNNGKQR